MAGLKIHPFSGETPRLTAKSLPESGSQLASNAKLTSGDLGAWNAPLHIETLSKWVSSNDPVKSVHRVNRNGTDYWLHWIASELNQNEVVKLFPSPTVNDTYDRLYFNKAGKLYVTTKALATTGAGTNYPLAAYELGVAPPVDIPGVTAAASPTETQEYAYTYYSSAANKESSLLSPTRKTTGYPLASGDWTLSFEPAPSPQVGFEVEYPTSRRIYRYDSGSASFKRISEISVTTPTLVDSNLPFNTIYAAGTLTYNAQLAPTVTAAENPVLDESIAYVYTFVSIYGEESAPSPAQTEFATGQPVSPSYPWNITMAATPGVGNRAPYLYRNIYRSESSADGTAVFQFVAQIPVAQTTYGDTTADTGLGEELVSDGWVQPPTSVSGFTYMGNGVFAVTSGKTLYLSEPFQPHAFPTAYQRALGFDGVALEAIGNSLIVLTNGDPVVLTGTDPAFLSDAKLDINQPCVSAATVVNVGSAVAYMSPVGYVYAGLGGSQVLTRDLFAKSDWLEISPSSGSFATRYDDGLMFFTPGRQYLITPSEQLSRLTSVNLTEVTALYTDPETGLVYAARNGGLVQWDANTTKLAYLWRSKVFSTPRQLNFGAAQISSNSGITGNTTPVPVVDGLGINERGINGAPVPYVTTDPTVTFRLYAYAPNTETYVLKHTQAVAGTEPFRLPSGYKSDAWYFELEGTATVHAVALAETMENLKAITA